MRLSSTLREDGLFEDFRASLHHANQYYYDFTLIWAGLQRKKSRIVNSQFGNNIPMVVASGVSTETLKTELLQSRTKDRYVPDEKVGYILGHLNGII